MLIGSSDASEAGDGRGGPTSEVLIGSARPEGEPTPAPGPAGGTPDNLPPPPPAAGAQRSFVHRWAAAALAVAVIAGLTVGLILALLRVSDLDSLNAARSSALAAAKTYSVEVASYDYRHLTQDFGAVEAHSTASFKATWSQSSRALVPVLTKYHATSVAKVVAAGVESASTNQVVAVVFVNQTVTNDTQSQPTTDQSRLEITLVRQHGQWLVNKLNLL